MARGNEPQLSRQEDVGLSTVYEPCDLGQIVKPGAQDPAAALPG